MVCVIYIQQIYFFQHSFSHFIYLSYSFSSFFNMNKNIYENGKWSVCSFIYFSKNIKIIYIYQTFERWNFNVYLVIFVIVSEVGSVKTWLFCWNSWKNNDIKGANKSLVIHKTSQNNRNNIILWCIWVKSHAGSAHIL
jgi:hypothetical protein